MTQPLPGWAADLLDALEIDPVEVDVPTLEELSTRTPDDPTKARLLIGFIAGYAAGLAQGGSMASFDRAHAASLRFLRKQLMRE